jgi:hypothetical protein
MSKLRRIKEGDFKEIRNLLSSLCMYFFLNATMFHVFLTYALVFGKNDILDIYKIMFFLSSTIRHRQKCVVSDNGL